MCKKQASVSHSSTESEIISLYAGLFSWPDLEASQEKLGAQFWARFVQDPWLVLVGGCEAWSRQLEKRQIQFLSKKLCDVGEDPGWFGRRPFLRTWPRSLMWVSSEYESQLNSIESMPALLSSLIVCVIFHGGTGGQEHSCCLQQLCTPSCSHVTISESTVLKIWILKNSDGFGILNFLNFELWSVSSRGSSFCAFLCLVSALASLMLRGSWPLASFAEIHEWKPFRSTQVVLVRRLSSIPRVLGLWVSSRSSTTLRYSLSTRMISCLTALRGLGSPSVPGFVVLLAPCSLLLVGSAGRDGLIFWSLESWWVHLWLSRCAASSAASCRGNSCRVSGAGMIVAMFRGFATLFLALLGSPEGSLIEMYCVLAWFGMLARGFLVASDGPI